MTTLVYGPIHISIETVTPAIAEKWLALNEGNRALRKSTAEQYARDMAGDDWHRKPVAICFDERGRLGNGQHTLTAICMSGRAQELMIARNVPRKSIVFMDVGLRRTMNDVATFIGSEIESRRAGIARVVKWGPCDAKPKSFDEIFEAYMENKDAIDFVVSLAPRKAGLNACVLGVCALAAMTQSRPKIARFISILEDGMADGDAESAAIRLRDFCRSLRGTQGYSLRLETYEKAMSALHHFLRGKGLTKLYGTSDNLFRRSTAVLAAAA